MDEIFTSADQCKIKTRSSSNKLIQPHHNRENGYKAISYLGPKLWNNLPLDTKTSRNPNSFKHKVKKLFFETLDKDNDDILSITNQYISPLPGKYFMFLMFSS